MTIRDVRVAGPFNRALAVVPAVAALIWLGMWARYYATTHYFVLSTIIQDDAFYYLLPAWNLPRLGWFTFDGVTPSYGFQPLWELVLGGLASAMPSKEMFLRSTLALGALLYAATAVVTGRVARAAWRGVNAEGGGIAGCAAAGMMLLNLPVAMANSAAKENALYGLLLSCLLLARIANRPSGLRAPAVRGILAGLALLTRLTPISLAIVVIERMPGQRSARWRMIAAYALAIFLTLLPWGLFALWTFGSAFPMSGRVKLRGVAADVLAGGAGFGASASAIVDYIGACVRFALGYSSRFWPDQVINQGLHRLPFLLLAAAGLVWAFRSRRWYLLLLTAGVLVALASVPVFLHLRTPEIFYARWYVVELPVIVAIFAGVGAEMIAVQLRRARPWAGSAAIVALIIAASPSVLDVVRVSRPTIEYDDRGEWQQVVLRLALTTGRDLNLGRNDKIGAFNAGLLGWFSDVPVINLDGLANDEILTMWTAGGSYQEYCRRRGITLFVDAIPPQKWFTEFTLVRTVPMTGSSTFPTYFIARLPPSTGR